VIETYDISVDIGSIQGKHSEKPEAARERIMELFQPENPLELFARRRVEGWTTLGNELDGLDITESLKRLYEGRRIPKAA
jgi:N6-adenosine-specific RNA methylase IME4